MRLRYLLLTLFLTTQAVAYYPCYGGCGAPPGVRERFPRHTACCCNQCQRVSPATGYSPCNAYRYRMGGSLELSADALYWASTLTPIVTSNQTGTGSVRVREISPGYAWGARGHVQWNVPCSGWFFRGGYHWVRSRNHSRDRGGPFTVGWINPGQGQIINATDSLLQITYQRAELTAGFNVWQGWCSRFYAYGGGQWFLFDKSFDSDLHATSTTADLSENARTQGVGGVIGVGGQFNVTQGLYGVIKLGAIAAAAERTRSQAIRGPTAVIPTGRFNGLYPSNWGLLPGIEGKVAARYTAGACGLFISGEIGWEIQHYFNAIRAQEGFIDIGFSGPYAGLKLRF